MLQNDNTPAFIELKNVSLRRNGRIIFENLNVKVPRGKVTVILGPSGAGKSTLLSLITGLLSPTSGEILLEGRSLQQLSKREIFMTRRRMGMMFQNSALFTNLSVYENLAFPLREHAKLPEEIIRTIVKMKLQAVGLRGAIDLFPNELSGGMGRRVALARAIIMDPSLIMYDEPFTGLDPISMAVIVKLIRHLNDAMDMTSIIVSHDVAEAASIADRMFLLANRHIIAEGSPEMMLANMSPDVRQFMLGLPDGAVPFHYPARAYQEDLLLCG